MTSVTDVWSAIWTLVTHLAGLSMISFGGINAVLPEIERLVANDNHWVTEQDFSHLYAIAQASPGPNVMIVALLGLRIGGLAGACAAALATFVPTSLLAYVVVNVWDRFREAKWRRSVQAGLVPVTIGFIASAAVLIARGADTSVMTSVITVATAAIAFLTKINPLWLFAVAGLLGALGFS